MSQNILILSYTIYFIDGLEKKARELYEDLWQLHGENYELKTALEKREVEVRTISYRK